MHISNMVYQGTVLGPPLWNIFYEDAAVAIHIHDFCEIVFADDLNAYKTFALATPNETLKTDMKKCQLELHKWGRANQVSFDASKESMHVLAVQGSEGANFRLLGVPFDNALSMRDAVIELVGECTWKMASILRTARFFTDGELVNLYKSQLLSYVEYRTPAIYHACDSILAPLNKFQDKFLAELGISAEDALFHFNLAPLTCRRDMAMLGLIHRCTLDKGPNHFKEVFKRSTAQRRNTRAGSKEHDKQLVDMRSRSFLEVERRSALGLIWVYNHLPQEIVSVSDVKGFQRDLQGLLKHQIMLGRDDWKSMLSPRIPIYRHPLRY